MNIVNMNHMNTFKEVMKTSVTRNITSAYTKSSNSQSFNPILQKFYKMMCEKLVSETVCGIFLSFVYTKNVIVKKIFWNCRIIKSWNIWKPYYFWKMSKNSFEDVVCTFKLEKIFCKKYLKKKKDLVAFPKYQTTNLGFIFLHTKFYTFSQVWNLMLRFSVNI